MSLSDFEMAYQKGFADGEKTGVAAERERCAKIVERGMNIYVGTTGLRVDNTVKLKMGMEIRTSSPDPNFLERERLVARFDILKKLFHTRVITLDQLKSEIECELLETERQLAALKAKEEK